MKNVSNEELHLVANTIRGLAMDGVQQANSGHPGLPMGMADVASVLLLGYLKHNPSNPDWADRDRFVLSGGHGSMLLYSMLHLSGYDLPLDELKAFRQWGSKTPGHPEYGHTIGVETTTGPLGQGCGNAVGMATAERMLQDRFNNDDFQPVDHHTFVMCGDGDLMEGLSHEAFSIAGHLGLNKLVVFYDSNRITIEGSTDLAETGDIKKRFQSYNFNVIEIDAHDYEQIEKAIKKAIREKTRPSMIICHSHIGWGSPNKVDTASAHGEPLGVDEIKATKLAIGLPEDQDFYVSEQVRELLGERAKKLSRMNKKWDRDFKKFTEANPERAQAWKQHMENHIPENLETLLPNFEKATATRSASGDVIQELCAAIPQLVGGSADLAPSTKTFINDANAITKHAFCGRNFHFGIREHAMGSVMNGIALHGGFRIFGATFFVFSDYCRPAIRLAALMNLPVIYVFTHDSFFVGEDGPTHQPIEHLAALRVIPNVTVFRPADPTETGAAWIAALKNTTGPSILALTRQNLEVIDRSVYPAANNVEKGGYVLKQTGEGEPDVTLIATGSEVQLALDAADQLANEKNIRVVSMPSCDLFDQQDAAYKASVIPAGGGKVAIEAGVSSGWEKYIGLDGKTVCIDHFGASAPYQKLTEEFGFTVENVVATIKSLN